ncbi:heavy metal translocating P-type ATPase [Rhodohalobacter sp. 614A]|uniref:heavy metal translocating P-type ATPase n=1 Tax=Rhodohalobacter sp. 614A TaxID=2908649 RepID=UPI001F32F684|nr:heavy metal translocating P-type ATPase [Rhodohalobacter sp. 614A]
MSTSHTHTRESCCSPEPDTASPDCCSADAGHDHNHSHDQDENASFLRRHWQPITSFILLITGLILDFFIEPAWFSEPVRIAWYIIAYLPVGLPVVQQGLTQVRKGNVFTEFFLMGIATVGAFLIGEYPEGVAVMLFYSVGEAFQHGAVARARGNIKSLLDIRPNTAHVKRGNTFSVVHPKDVAIGEIIQVKPGERIPLDGNLITQRAAFDTSAITGESKPRHFKREEKVLSGFINQDQVIEMEVTSTYENNSITRILKMVEDAASRKSKTEQFIRSFARIYTPIVVLLATLLVLTPWFFVNNYVFDEWFYRGLVFLVISCPCALVISIPLGYFGGIGAASRNGILVKGSNYLDALKSVKTVVFDKTGTLTKGVFAVQDFQSFDHDEDELYSYLHAAEKNSTHPIAKAITAFTEIRNGAPVNITKQSEIPGHGIHAIVDGSEILIGNKKLMDRENIYLNGFSKDSNETVIHVAVNGSHAGLLTISDEVKDDSIQAIQKIRDLGVERTFMLSGDIQSEADRIGNYLKIDQVFGELLPEEKAEKLEKIQHDFEGTTAYVGDGINDAPVLALSDIGIAMGAMGSDAAIETADVVIQTDQPSKLATAISISQKTRNIVWQNIGLAMGVKGLVLFMGAVGMATLWEAVFADVGVALLAVLNAIRIQRMNFE